MVFQRVLTDFPPNVAVDPSGLDGVSLNQRQMYVRCNYPVPFHPPQAFEVVLPDRPVRRLDTSKFTPMRTVTIDMVLECAGNGRSLMEPVPEGVPWPVGAASPVTVSGVRLAEALGDLPQGVVDLVFTGADGYQFSVDRELYESNRCLLVTHIGGEPLDMNHGAPVRLMVPGHYGMKSVKWLTRVEGMTSKFTGVFVKQYRYYQDTHEPDGTPVSDIMVRSIISSPVDGDSIPGPSVDVMGSAWTGTGEVEVVEVSGDGGQTWEQADLVHRETGGKWAPRRWAVTIELDPGRRTIMARATDSEGNTQPLEPRWNRNGYANNLVHTIGVDVT